MPSKELIEANNAAVKGDLEGSLKLLNALGDEEKDGAQALNIKAICLTKLNRIDEAAEVWKALWNGPNAPGGAASEKAKQNYERIQLNVKGKALQKANAELNGPHGTDAEDFRRLAKNFEAIDVTDPVTDEIKFLVKHNAGICYMQAQDWREAADTLNAAIDLKPGDSSLAPVQHDVGEALRQLEDYAGAEKAFERCMSMYDDAALPQHKYASLKGLVEAQIRQEKYEPAIKHADDLLSMAQTNDLPLFEPHYWRGTAHFKGGDAAMGAEDLSAAVDIAKDPSADLGGVARADLPNVIREAINAIITEGENKLLNKSEYAEAHPFFEKALDCIDSCPDIGDDEQLTREGAALNDAVCLAHTNNWEGARDIIEDQIKRTDPERGWKLLGAIYTEGLDNPEKAKECYEHATGLAGTYAPKGYAPEPAKWRETPCSASRAHILEDAASLHNLGFACYKLDALYGARDAFQSALKVDPDNEATKQCLLLILSLLESRERRLGAELDKLAKDKENGAKRAEERDAKLNTPHDSEDSAELQNLDDGLKDLDSRAKALKDKADTEGVKDVPAVAEALDALDQARADAEKAVKLAKELCQDPAELPEEKEAKKLNEDAKKLREAANKALDEAEKCKQLDGTGAQEALDKAKEAAALADAADAKADEAVTNAQAARDAKAKDANEKAAAALKKANQVADAADAAIDKAAEKKRADEAAQAERDALKKKLDVAKQAVEAAKANAADVLEDPLVEKALADALKLVDDVDKALDLAEQGLVTNADAGKALEKLEAQIPPLEDIVNDAVSRAAKNASERDALKKRVAASVDAEKAAEDLAKANGILSTPEVEEAAKKYAQLKKLADDAIAEAAQADKAGSPDANKRAADAVAALEAQVPILQDAVNSKLESDAKKRAEADAMKQKLHNAEHAADIAKAKADKLQVAPELEDVLENAKKLRMLAESKVKAFEDGGDDPTLLKAATEAVDEAERAANDLDAKIADLAAAKKKREAEEEARRKAEEARKKREKEELDDMRSKTQLAKDAADDAKRDALAEDPTLLEDDDVAAALREAERLRRLAEQALIDAAAGKISNADALLAVEAAENAYRAFRNALNEARLRRQRERERKALRRTLDQAAKTIDNAPAWAKQRNFIHEAEYPKELIAEADQKKLDAQAKLAKAETHPDDVEALDEAKAAVKACADAAKQVSIALDEADRAYRKRRRREADEKEAELRRRLEEEEENARRKAQSFYDHINRKNMAAMGLGDLVESTKAESHAHAPTPTTAKVTEFDYSIVFPYAQLTADKAPNFPAGVDPANREKFLSEAEFSKILGCEKSAFSAMPKWKREAYV